MAETVRCGPGNELASVDETDRVIGCEKVHPSAPQEEWLQFGAHINAYGAGGFFERSGWGKCSPARSDWAGCKGGGEGGTAPFDKGEINMDWKRVTGGGSGQDVTIAAPEADATLLGSSDTGWRYVEIDSGRVREFVDRKKGIFRTGSDVGKVGEKGGPLRANLSHHGYLAEPQRNGYSLDLRGWLRIIRF